MLDIGLEASQSRASSSWSKSFNPSCAGYRSGRKGVSIGEQPYFCFNPSCAGYRSGRIGSNSFFIVVIGVSILLVLDIGLEVERVEKIEAGDESFNPSCAGYRSGS